MQTLGPTANLYLTGIPGESPVLYSVRNTASVNKKLAHWPLCLALCYIRAFSSFVSILVTCSDERESPFAEHRLLWAVWWPLYSLTFSSSNLGEGDSTALISQMIILRLSEIK